VNSLFERPQHIQAVIVLHGYRRRRAEALQAEQEQDRSSAGASEWRVNRRFRGRALQQGMEEKSKEFAEGRGGLFKEATGAKALLHLSNWLTYVGEFLPYQFGQCRHKVDVLAGFDQSCNGGEVSRYFV